jgi:hypothetical protein
MARGEPTIRLQRPKIVMKQAAFVIGLTALLAAGCSSGAWGVTSKGSKLRVDVEAGCPRSVVGYVGVVSTYGGSKLVPADPTGGIICRYSPTGDAAPAAGQLTQQTRLDSAQAANLATAIRSLKLGTQSGKVECPAYTGKYVVIGLSYASQRDVGLWYGASGCGGIDNGRIGTDFFGAVADLLPRLSPPG